MSTVEYRTAYAARGGLLFMRDAPGIALGDRVVITDRAGRRRSGQVIASGRDSVLVQVLEGSDELDLAHTWVRFLDAPFALAVSRELLGRVFTGTGAPRDGRPPLFAGSLQPVHGAPLNPAARAYPSEFIETGVSAIDGLNALVRGQKLPIFSASGLPHHRLAAQIVRQARLPGDESHFAIVFAAMGVSHAEAAFFTESFAESGVLAQVAMFVNLADDPPLERLILPRSAMTAAEYLAFELDLHVLVVMTDMTLYADALREVTTARGDVPSRKGYPGFLYSDLAEIYERAGRIRGKAGSITLLPVLSMPADDITHPVPDLSGYITEGQIVLTRELHARGVYPPIAVLPSLSRLMKDGIGKERTRADHPQVASQLFASYARALEARNLAAIIGAEDLPASDRRYLEFADAFERRLIGQEENEARTIAETLNIAWQLLSLLPAAGLTRLDEDLLARYHRPPVDSEARSASEADEGDHAA